MTDLVLENLDIAETLAKLQTRITRLRFDDLLSVAYEGLVIAARDYKEGTASFRTYARWRVMGELKDYVREVSKQKKWSLLNEDVEWQTTGCEDFARFLLKPLSVIARKILWLRYVEHLSHEEIGKQTGYSETNVSKLVSLHKRALKEYWKYRMNEIYEFIKPCATHY